MTQKNQTPRQVEKKKLNFKIIICMLSSNFLLIFSYIVLNSNGEDKTSTNHTLPNGYQPVLIKAFSHVDGENIQIQASDSSGKIIIEKGYLLEKKNNQIPPLYKIAVSKKIINRLLKNNQKELYLYPYTKKQSRKFIKNQRSYEINF